MCNPRRVRVRATRELAEAWEQEVRRQVVRQGRTVGEARVREPMEDSIGGPTLAALTAVLDRLDGWEEGPDGIFWHELDGGQISFDPATRELEIVATAAADITVTGEASTVVTTSVTDTVEAEGVGVYYDDNWGGITEDDARRAAQTDLGRALDEQLQARRDTARDAADTEAGTDVERLAVQRADSAFADAAEARAAELRREATDRLIAVGAQGRALFHTALAEAYRDAILAFARSRGARNLRHSQAGGTLDIEFELEI